MLTTCPECQTTFRVTQEHLGLRRGLVRCGHCGVVFNAYDSLLAELVTPPPDAERTPRETPRGINPPPPEPQAFASPAPLSPVAAPAAPEPGEAAADAEEDRLQPPPPAPPPAAQNDMAAPAAEASPAPQERPQETSESILLSELPTRIVPGRRPRPPRRPLKAALALLLAAALVLQLLIFLRASLAAALPAARPLLAALCEPLHCTVPLPRQLDQSAIVASSLEHDAENRSRSRLTLLLANRGGQAQDWPHIVLTLTDMRDSPVAQRVFAPGEYLAANGRLASGMAANEEREIRLDLDTGTLAATGYALDLAYR